MRAIWKNTILSKSDDTIELEGNHYFPATSLHWNFFIKSDRRSTCPWKGEATYFTIKVGTFVNPDAAWTYPETTPKAKQIKGYVAFWKDVQVAEI